MRFTLEYLEQVPYEVLNDPPESQASREEIIARVSKYMVMDSLKLPFSTETKTKVARNEVNGHKTFPAAVGKAWTQKYGNRCGLELADLEIEAEFLGVFSDIWPSGPEDTPEADSTEAELAAQ